MNDIGEQFFRFITSLKAGDVIRIYFSDYAEVHGPDCDHSSPGNNAVECGASCMSISELFLAEETVHDRIQRNMAWAVRCIGGALGIRGLMLSQPRIVNRDGDPFPNMMEMIQERVKTPLCYAFSDLDDAEDECQHLFETDGWIEYTVVPYTPLAA